MSCKLINQMTNKLPSEEKKVQTMNGVNCQGYYKLKTLKHEAVQKRYMAPTSEVDIICELLLVSEKMTISKIMIAKDG